MCHCSLFVALFSCNLNSRAFTTHTVESLWVLWLDAADTHYFYLHDDATGVPSHHVPPAGLVLSSSNQPLHASRKASLVK